MLVVTCMHTLKYTCLPKRGKSVNFCLLCSDWISIFSCSLFYSEHSDGDETYLSEVVECYSHLIHCLPDLRKYLQSVSHLVLEENRKGRTLAQYVDGEGKFLKILLVVEKYCILDKFCLLNH